MKNMFFNSVLVAFVLLVASCSKQPEAKVVIQYSSGPCSG